MTRRALVVTHGGRSEAVLAMREAVQELEAAGVEPVVVDEDATAHDLPEVEIAVVLGGDGTILRAAELTRACGIPLLGVNLGHVGFLAESERDDVGEAVRRVTAGDFTVEERMTIAVRVQAPDGRVVHDWALNEAALEKGESRILEVAVEVDGRPLSSFGCDGIVTATATGSTAHAFSAGGPVVWPDVDGMILVPMSAHALFARPLVVGPRSTLAIEVLDRSPAAGLLTCDGRRRLEVPRGSRVEITRSPVPVRLARLTPAPFTTRLVNKFALPVEGWRGRGTAHAPATVREAAGREAVLPDAPSPGPAPDAALDPALDPVLRDGITRGGGA
ncbi:NAD kinase [Cellulomonas gilvus]|uniref:NAD kinase n=1 Tax=Cellulomonas gilvus (strain ATCC 13127 / NRRL B-14078) TaxID=593907 RepID=F8A7N8_CELGA|nr:NAD kinase [Cellulomonas gilvus]AEI12440.1 ATP-NAD/AcoX kinase [Cellulomonas gilvus ATCC 13127]